jgi:hypothetical protein
MKTHTKELIKIHVPAPKWYGINFEDKTNKKNISDISCDKDNTGKVESSYQR